MNIVRCDNLRKYFPVTRRPLKEGRGVVKAVDGVTLSIEKGETFGLVGESASGKTTLGKIILGIIKPDSGRVKLATDKVQAIFQNPASSLDPKMRVKDIVAEGLIVRRLGNNRAGFPAIVQRSLAGSRLCGFRGRGNPPCIIDEVRKVLDLVRLPKESINKYPHQFSGGERQRIAIARTVITQPELIVCDEPVSSLDVTVQLQILKLLKEIQKDFGITYLFISHDLRVIKYMCSRVAVMRQGKIVEEGKIESVYSNPSVPYTKLLLSSILDIYPPKPT